MTWPVDTLLWVWLSAICWQLAINHICIDHHSSWAFHIHQRFGHRNSVLFQKKWSYIRPMSPLQGASWVYMPMSEQVCGIAWGLSTNKARWLGICYSFIVDALLLLFTVVIGAYYYSSLLFFTCYCTCISISFFLAILYSPVTILALVNLRYPLGDLLLVSHNLHFSRSWWWELQRCMSCWIRLFWSLPYFIIC